MTFKNLPTDHKGVESELKNEQDEDKRETRRLLWLGVRRGLMWIPFSILVGFWSVDGYVFAKNIYNRWEELEFTFNHPELVKPIREIYTQSHQKADEDLKQILSGGK